MPRAFLTVLLAVTVVATAALFIFQRGEVGEIAGQKASIGGLTKTAPLSEIDTLANIPGSGPHISVTSDPNPAGSDPAGSNEYLDEADRYLAEALPIIDPKQRFVLIEKINGFNASYDSALSISGPDPGILIRATSRYIATWSPFYYTIHSDAAVVLGKVIKTLEGERVRMLEELARRDAQSAGRLAAEDIEYYIEDIRKSAARRNSDFIAFSILNYEQYREAFDELSREHKGFLSGFAEQAYILFDDFYRMHEEVDEDYLDKTRKKGEGVRLELRNLHRSALVELAQSDSVSAQEALEKAILVIEQEISARSDRRKEIHDIMKSDNAFYANIQL